MASDNNNDDYDYFDGDDIEEPKKPEETPEEKEERELAKDTIEVGHNKYKIILWSCVGVVVLILLIFGWMHFYHPYVALAEQPGTVWEFNLQGNMFKTYEGKLVPEDHLTDTRLYPSDNFLYSVEDDSIAKIMFSLQKSGKRVILKYKRYSGTLPWRGDSKNIVYGVVLADTVTFEGVHVGNNKPQDQKQ